MPGRTFEIVDARGPLTVDVDERLKSFAVADDRGDLVGTGVLARRQTGHLEVADCSLGVTEAMMDAIEGHLNGAGDSTGIVALPIRFSSGR